MTTGLSCVLAAALLCSSSGVPYLRADARGRAAGLLLALLGSGLGLLGIALALGDGQAGVALPWAVPGGALALQIVRASSPQQVAGECGNCCRSAD